MIKSLISLELAKKKKFKYYFTGKPCSKGHLVERYTSTRACKECARININKNRKENPLRTKLQSQKDNLKYYRKHKKKILINSKKYMTINKDKFKDYYSNWHRENYKKNKQYILERGKIYYKNNRVKIQNRLNKYRRKRRSEDPTFKLIDNLRRRVNQSISHCRYERTSSTRNWIGCSIKELKIHLEKQWKPGMNWENYNYTGWHIDHKIPVHFFKTNYDFSNPKIQKRCFNYKNLQPMWAKENLKKSSKTNYATT